MYNQNYERRVKQTYIFPTSSKFFFFFVGWEGLKKVIMQYEMLAFQHHGRLSFGMVWLS